MRAKPQWTTERAVQRADAIMTEECEHDEIRDVADCPVVLCAGAAVDG